MSGIDSVDGARLEGATDGTPIGNVGDRMLQAPAISTGDSLPVPSGYQNIASSYTNTALQTDYYGNLNTRSQVLTDEGSVRDDFVGNTLTGTLTGTLSYTNNSRTVTGTGTLFTTELNTDLYIKKTTDADTLFVQVLQIISDTELLLADVYTGTTGSSASNYSTWLRVLGGGTANVATSNVTIASSTNANGKTYLQKSGDYGPMSFIAYASVSQRIALQQTIIGFRDVWSNPTLKAEFNFNGTVNTQVQCITSSSSSASDTQTSTITIPNAGTSAVQRKYTVDVADEKVTFLIDDIVVATHQIHIPGPYAELDMFLGVDNNGSANSTSLVVDFAQFKNYDRVNVGTESPNAPVLNQLVATATDGSTKGLTIGTNGEVIVLNNYANKATYSATALGLSAANNATDIFTLTGSATKTITVTKLQISATQTTATSNNIVLLKRSTANTGGTSSTLTAVPMDSLSAAATATARSYTVNPTGLGTLVGNLRAHKLFIPTTTGVANILDYKFGENDRPLILRGTGEVLAVNLNSTTLSGNNFNIFIEWTEE